MAIFTNQATLSYNNNVRNSNIVTGELLEVLSANKTVTQDNYRPGETVNYVINIINTGTTDYNNLTVTDNLGEYATATGTAVPLDYETGTVRYFVNGTPQAVPTVTGTNPLTVTGINVPAGGNAAIVYTARVNQFAPLTTDGTVNNTATVTGAGITEPIIASASVPVDNAPDLAIAKSVNPVSISGNGPLTYTFVISNSGNTEATAGDNLVVRDTFDPLLNITDVSLDGTALTEPADYTYDTATGEFVTTAGRITVPAATFTTDPATGETITTNGTSTLTVTGTVV